MVSVVVIPELVLSYALLITRSAVFDVLPPISIIPVLKSVPIPIRASTVAKPTFICSMSTTASDVSAVAVVAVPVRLPLHHQ